jgi:hypothetical protein
MYPGKTAEIRDLPGIFGIQVMETEVSPVSLPANDKVKVLFPRPLDLSLLL